MTVFAAEAAAEVRTARRTGLLALADYLTSLDTYPDPWDVFAAFCPGVSRDTVEKWSSELLRCAVDPDNRRVNEHNIDLALDYLTGDRW
jgi:hypothetical protein